MTKTRADRDPLVGQLARVSAGPVRLLVQKFPKTKIAKSFQTNLKITMGLTDLYTTKSLSVSLLSSLLTYTYFNLELILRKLTITYQSI